MVVTLTDPSPRSWARLAGAGYLVIIVAGLFAELGVRQALMVPGDAAATAANLAASAQRYRLGIAADLVMVVTDVLVAGALYALFRVVHQSLAALGALLRVAHAASYAAVLLAMYLPLLLVGPGADTAAIPEAQRQGLALVLLQLHGYGYAVALAFFGAHCLVLGWLVKHSGLVPPVLGVLLMIAGAGYLLDTFARTVLLDYDAVATGFGLVVFVPAVVAELSFCLWLLIKGVRDEA